MDTTTTTSVTETATTPPSIVSRESRPFNEVSQATPGVQSLSDQPKVMLAPTTRRSPDRDRTLLEEGAKITPKTETSKDEVDKTGGAEFFPRENKKDAPPLSENDDGDSSIDRKRKRTKFLLIGLAIGVFAAFIVFLVLRTRREIDEVSTNTNAFDSNNAFDFIPTLDPTTHNPTSAFAPTLMPSASNEPTLSFSPTLSPSESRPPTGSPSSSPSAVPSATPTVSPKPTVSSSEAPTLDLVTLMKEFLFGIYGVDVSSGSKTATSNRLAIEWLASEARESKTSLELNGKLVQRFALVAIDISLQGAKAWDGPRSAQQGVDVCDWQGIQCNSENYVEKILWDYQPEDRHGSGTISSEVGLLVGSLKVLDLSNSGLVGKIPEELYKLTNLEKLFLFKNQLEGTISANIGDLDAITHLHLSHNKLSGKIPNEVKSDGDGIRPLEYFNLYSNKLTGTLPEAMRLRLCVYFDVGRNELTGTLPEDLGENFIALRHLYLDHNKFKGTLPSSYNNVGNGRLESFSINNNELTGVVPGDRKMYNKLVQYILHSNQFDRMSSDVCQMEIPQNEMAELSADCDICRCSGFFDICDRQCIRDEGTVV